MKYILSSAHLTKYQFSNTASQTCQGHHSPFQRHQGTTGLPGAPVRGTNHRPARRTRGTNHGTARGTTCPARAPQACQGIAGLSGAPQSLLEASGHHRPVRGASQRHYGPARGTTGLPGAPQACQGHHLSGRGTTGLPGTSQTCQGHRSSCHEHQG